MSATRPGGDEPNEPEEPGKPSSGRQPESPLDDLFIVGAKYHEPSAAERAAAAKEAERASKKAAKAHEKEIARTRKLLGGDNKPTRRGHERRHRDFSVANFERRTALLGFLAIVAISVALSFTAFGH